MMERRILTTVQAAEYLGLSVQALALARKTGDLFGQLPPPFIKLGQKTIRYKREDVESWANRLPTWKTNDEPKGEKA